MKQSKVSFSQEQERSYETLSDVDPILKNGNNQSFQNSAEIHLMQAFIQNKYSQVADLQKFLVQELQEIQNGKSRNQRIEKLLVTNAIPTLQDIKSLILSIKQAFQPFCYLSVNYIQAVSEKCRGLLQEKEETIKKYQIQVETLRQEVRILKEQGSKRQTINNRVTENNLRDKKQQKRQPYSHKQTSQTQTPSNFNATQCKSFLRIDQSLSEKNLSLCNVSNKSKSISPLKPNKYQECYRNILQNKKVNINYRCDKSPCFQNVSPMKGLKNTPKATADGLKERKDYIKLKIEKIKSKAENRECWIDGSTKGRLK